jgi:hypothetical protein
MLAKILREDFSKRKRATMAKKRKEIMAFREVDFMGIYYLNSAIGVFTTKKRPICTKNQ